MQDDESTITDADTKMIDLSVQPPPQVRPGAALFPPIAARLRSSANMYNELSQIWALTTLVDHHGQVLEEQLGGRTADSAHPMSQATHSASHQHSSSGRSKRDQAYFYFPDLTIHTPGRYRVRVTLMRMRYTHEYPEGVAVAEDYADSRSIVVEEGVTNHARPSSREREFLRILSHDGQDVPTGPA